jgi:hypothetical protein
MPGAEDPAPDPEAALPDLEDALPLRVGHLAPAREHVVEPRADDAARDSPHGDAEDEIPVAAPPRPADAGQPRGREDPEQEHDAVGVKLQGADVDAAAGGAGNGREQKAHAGSLANPPEGWRA